MKTPAGDQYSSFLSFFCAPAYKAPSNSHRPDLFHACYLIEAARALCLRPLLSAFFFFQEFTVYYDFSYTYAGTLQALRAAYFFRKYAYLADRESAHFVFIC